MNMWCNDVKVKISKMLFLTEFNEFQNKKVHLPIFLENAYICLFRNIFLR